MDETIFIEGPRDLVHHYDLLPQFATVRLTYVKKKTSHRLRNLEWRELSFEKTRDGFERCGKGYEAVFDALAPAEARARVPEVERPHLYFEIKERLHQTVGSRKTAVFTKDTPRDFIKSPEHVGPREGRLPLPGRPLHQSHVRFEEGAEALVT